MGNVTFIHNILLFGSGERASGYIVFRYTDYMYTKLHAIEYLTMKEKLKSASANQEESLLAP